MRSGPASRSAALGGTDAMPHDFSVQRRAIRSATNFAPFTPLPDQTLTPSRPSSACTLWHIAKYLCGAAVLVWLTQTAQAQGGNRPQFFLPIACELGKDCFVQNYFDTDPGPGAQDFSCGGATYDGHKGIDIRLISNRETEKPYPVLAAASGKVRGARDGMPDLLLRRQNASALANRECGNGVVIEHDEGWETQYCHLRQGSVVVKQGMRVTAGQMLGFVGFSGMADFAHVHFEVRHQGKPIDPFTGQPANASCTVDPATPVSLWAGDVNALGAALQGAIIEAVFSASPPDLSRAEDGLIVSPVTTESAQIFQAARLINLRRGDRVQISLTGPANFKTVSQAPPLDRNKAVVVVVSSAKRGPPSWPEGAYTGGVQIVRNGAVIQTTTTSLMLQKSNQSR